jgi:beta-lactamase regulating signal transducer with metallopeptidase domain
MNTAIFTHALGWSLIHSLWQGLLIGVLVLASVSATSSSQRKYTIHCLGLLTLLISFSGTFFWEAGLITPASNFPIIPTTAITIARSQPLPSTAPILSPSTTQPPSQINWDKIASSLTWLWIIGVLSMILRAAFAARHVHSLRKSSVPLQDELWQTKLQTWATQLGIRKIVTLATTTLNDVPATIGHFKPLILLPAAILTHLTPEQIEALILHELAHIRRHDFLINALQIAAETLLFFHPIVWWLSRSIRHQRELCCDQIVAQRSNNRATYAKALLTLEELRVNSPGLLALSAAGSPLKQRITHLLHPEPSLRPQSWIISVGSLALFAALTLAVWPQTPTHAAAPSAATTSNNRLQLRFRSDDPSDAEEFSRANAQPGLGFPDKIPLSKKIIIDGSHIKTAEIIGDPNNPQIVVTVDPQGAARLSQAMKENASKKLVILFNGQILNAPITYVRDGGEQFMISGRFNSEEAAALASKLDPKFKPALSATAIRLESQVFELSEDPAQRFPLKNKLDSGNDEISLWDLTDEEARALIASAREFPGAKNLASPILTTFSGRAARIEIGAVPDDPKGGRFSVNAIGIIHNNQPASQSQPALIGQSLELLPEFSNDHFIIAGKFSHRQKLSDDDSAPIRTIYSAPIYVTIPKGHSIALVQRNKQTSRRFSNRPIPPPTPIHAAVARNPNTNQPALTTPPLNKDELKIAQEELKRIKGIYTDEHPAVQRQQQIVNVLQAGNASTNTEPGQMGMMYLMQNPELMKRYFPNLYEQMQKGGSENHLLLIISPKLQQ